MTNTDSIYTPLVSRRYLGHDHFVLPENYALRGNFRHNYGTFSIVLFTDYESHTKWTGAYIDKDIHGSLSALPVGISAYPGQPQNYLDVHFGSVLDTALGQFEICEPLAYYDPFLRKLAI